MYPPPPPGYGGGKRPARNVDPREESNIAGPSRLPLPLPTPPHTALTRPTPSNPTQPLITRPHTSHLPLARNPLPPPLPARVQRQPRPRPPVPPAAYQPDYNPNSPSNGFQTDYARSNTRGEVWRKPGQRLGRGRKGSPRHGDAESRAGAVVVGRAKRIIPPVEAYMIVRGHKSPRDGWVDDTPRTEDTSRWKYQLNVLQNPIRGQALGALRLRRGFPALSPPLIFELKVYDKDDQAVPPDNTTLVLELVHLVVSVALVSDDGESIPTTIRIKTPPPLPSTPAATPSIEPSSLPTRLPPGTTTPTLLNSTSRLVQTYSINNERGIFFVFQDLVVRPVGDFAIRARLLDVSGPSHLGTSIGVTGSLTECLTQPFKVYDEASWPGRVPPTDLSAEFVKAGERNMGDLCTISTVPRSAFVTTEWQLIYQRKTRDDNDDGDSNAGEGEEVQ